MRIPAVVVALATAGLTAAGGLGAQPPTVSTSADGAFTLAQAKRGAVHVERCVPCHGDDLEGSLAPPLVGPVHLDRWQGRSLAELYERIQGNFDGLAKRGTPDEAGTVPERAADFTAYLLLMNGFRAGTSELPPRVDVMRAVRLAPPGRAARPATSNP